MDAHGLISQDDVDHPRPSGSRTRLGPAGRVVLGFEPGEEAAVAQRFDRSGRRGAWGLDPGADGATINQGAADVLGPHRKRRALRSANPCRPLGPIALAACLALRRSRPAANETAADVVTLRDGKTVSGELIEPWNPGSVGLYVRRAWAREHVPEWADRWEAAEAPTAAGRRPSSRPARRLATRTRSREARARTTGSPPGSTANWPGSRDGDATRSPGPDRPDCRATTSAP